MGHCLFMRKGETHTAPISGILLSDIAEGSIVKVNEGGSPVEFYVAKHDYESALNGEGRTLLVRKDCYIKSNLKNQSATYNNAYTDGELDSFMRNAYKDLFDQDTQTAIGETEIYYTPGNGNTEITTLVRSFFALSLKELNLTYNNANEEGSVLPIADSLKPAYYQGEAAHQWTRTPANSSSKKFMVVCTSSSIAATGQVGASLCGIRPAFTLPYNALFDTNTLNLKGVA